MAEQGRSQVPSFRGHATVCHLSPKGRGRIASSDAIRVRGLRESQYVWLPLTRRASDDARRPLPCGERYKQGGNAVRINWKTIAPLGVWLVLWLIPVPAGLNANQWHYFALFAGVIAGLI